MSGALGVVFAGAAIAMGDSWQARLFLWLTIAAILFSLIHLALKVRPRLKILFDPEAVPYYQQLGNSGVFWRVGVRNDGNVAARVRVSLEAFEPRGHPLGLIGHDLQVMGRQTQTSEEMISPQTTRFFDVLALDGNDVLFRPFSIEYAQSGLRRPSPVFSEISELRITLLATSDLGHPSRANFRIKPTTMPDGIRGVVLEAVSGAIKP